MESLEQNKTLKEDNEKYCGSIHLILGCMFSGKTTELVRNIKRFRSIGRTTMVINYHLDNRYGENTVSTHDSIGVDAYMINNLNSIHSNEKLKNIYSNSKYIFINEGQFFENLYNFCVNAANNDNKIVYICGLDGDFKQQKFGQLIDLIPVCDSLIKLHALCKICGCKASFTKRNSDEGSQVVIGNGNMYSAVCRKHYLE